jgi:23S rRNA (uracil1939-C5)-methyltransferase
MADTFDVRIESLAYGGEAVARLPDGRAVFVPYTIPGELVAVKLVEDKAHHARADLVEVLEPSAERVRPRCQHFTTCGGCHYQHMNYTAQVKAKAEILREQMSRIGGLKDIPEIGVMAADQAWYYRNHMQFHLSEQGKLGFQKARSHQAFAIRECHLPETGINRLWPKIDIEPMAEMKRINVRQGAEEELMIVLESSTAQALDFSIEGLPLSVIQVSPKGRSVLAGSDYLIMEILGRRFKVSATSFFQVNSQQATHMVEYLLRHLALDETKTALDVYAGVGMFSAFVAPRVKRLVGVEISAEACEDFTTNLDEFDNVELYEAGAEEVLGNLNFTPDAIVMDPPRAGLGEGTARGILSQGANTLVYVSCDPATLARDGKQLAAGGYRLKRMTLIDMFPQTYHIESLSLWEKKSKL